LFQTLGDIETFQINHFENFRECELRALGTSSPRSSYWALSGINNWYEYFTTFSGQKHVLEGLVNPDFSLNTTALPLLGEQDRAQMKSAYYYFLSRTATLSMALTILAALEKGMNDLSSRTSLTISLVGARSSEIESAWVFEELLHLLPKLHTLNLMFVGPESKVINPDGKGNILEYENCPACKSLHKKRVGGLHCGFYHDFIKEPYYQKPDLAVLFHSGRSQSEVESWAPTTRFLVDSGTLTLCTTWTQREALEEVGGLDRLGARFLIRPEENKWRSLVPLLDFLEGADDAVYYVNYYKYIFQGK
jgi:mitochondrial splicing suppressor protein 51